MSLSEDDDGRTAKLLGNIIVGLLALLFVGGVAYWFVIR
jgi:hypothetical protein